MNETYRCPDGREVLLRVNENTLRVDATTRDGETIGSFQFALIGSYGEETDLRDDIVEAFWLKLARSDLLGGWHNQGIRERAKRLVSNETMLALAD